MLDASMLEDFGSGFHCGASESGNVASGIAAGTDLIDHAAVINS